MQVQAGVVFMMSRQESNKAALKTHTTFRCTVLVEAE